MSLNTMDWDTNFDPDKSNILTWAHSLYDKFQPIEQARWNQSNIDTLFYAGEQSFINSHFDFSPGINSSKFHFNFIQQPVNMVTGYQRQHRKSINYLPIEGSKQEFADDLTDCISYANGYRNILEKYSTGCEQSAISGMVLGQPWLDFRDDPINGTMDLKIWPYNSFIIDPYFRDTQELSDCNFVWTQSYVSRNLAKSYFPNRADEIDYMNGNAGKNGKFYFLPENYNSRRSDFLVLSYIWYQSSRKKKFLYNRNDGITYDYSDDDKFLKELVDNTKFFEIIEIEVPTWKVNVILNDQLMFSGRNPLGFDECPFIPLFWNYDPHIGQSDLRVRSLVRSMRDSQFLLNRRIILNHDISESSINSGWIRLEDAVANEEVLEFPNNGKDILIKQGYQITDIQKIIPNAVPSSDMELSNQLADFIFKTSGVNQELMGMASDSDTGIETILRQGAGLVTLQKYFDQWDTALIQLGKLQQKIIQINWSPAKIARILGREPNPEFLNKTFSKYDVQVAEGLNTSIQKQAQFQQLMQLNEKLGGIIPARFILQNSTIHGKNDIIQVVDEQAKAQQEMQQQEMMLKQTLLETQIQNMQAQSVGHIALAHERHGRADSNIGLYEERLSQITKNRSMALKDKIEALEKLITIIRENGEPQVAEEMNELFMMNQNMIIQEDIEKQDAKEEANSNEFLINLMQQNQQFSNMESNNKLQETSL